MTTEAQKLARIRSHVEALAGCDWLCRAEGNGMVIDARGRDGSLVDIARVDPKADPDETEILVSSLDWCRFLLGLVDRAIRASRAAAKASAEDPAGDERRAPDFAAEAAMKCAEPGFLVFLEERHGLERPLTPERAAQKLRSALGVTSRKELNTDTRAADAWKALRRDYDQWRRTA